MQLTNGDDLLNAVLHAPIGMCLLDAPTLTAEVVNDKFIEVAGRPYENIFGKFYWDAFAEARPYYEAALSGVVETGEPYYADEVALMLIRHGKEELVYVTFVYSPVKDEDGSVKKVMVWVLENTRQVTERQKTEEARAAFQKERDRLKSFFMKAPAGICILDGPALIYELVNPGYQELLPGRDLLGRPLFEALPELVGTPLQQVLLDVYRTGNPYEINELLIPLAKYEGGPTDGRYFSFNYQARRDENDQIDGILAFVFEVTAMVKAQQDQLALNEELSALNEESAAVNEELMVANEQLMAAQEDLRAESYDKQRAIERLQASEQNIRNMVRQAPVGMCIVEGDPLYVVEVNDSFLELIGKTREALRTTPYWVVLAEAAAYYKPITDNVLATGLTYHANEHAIMLIRNGREEIVHVDFVYEPMKDADGKAYAIMIVAIDITEKVLARKRVERAQEQLRMAVDAAELGSYYINTTDRIFHASPRLKEFFGFNPDEEVPYEAAINQIHEDYRQAAADLVEAAITKGVRFDMEYPVVGYHDSKIRWVRGIGEVQHDADGKSYFTGVLHDITEKKQDELRKNDFIGMVSHELKTPLTSLNAIIQVANAKLQKSEDLFLAGAMSRAFQQVKRMSRMIDGFLNISRLEAGKILIEKHPFSIDQLVKEIAEEMKVTANTHVIDVETCRALEVDADHDKINSVISNLVSNAAKYSQNGSTITISCEVVGNEVRVGVRDEGMGLKPDDAKKIFQRYYRVESNKTRHISGFGIGLYLSAEIVERHGGRIWVESEAGAGSTFYFTLPVVG